MTDEKGVSTVDTPGEPVVSLSADEYLSLDFAAGMLDARADQLDTDNLAALGDTCRRQAAVLQRLHDRWHATSVLANEGRAHDGCAWCANGGAS